MCSSAKLSDVIHYLHENKLETCDKVTGIVGAKIDPVKYTNSFGKEQIMQKIAVFEIQDSGNILPQIIKNYNPALQDKFVVGYGIMLKELKYRANEFVVTSKSTAHRLGIFKIVDLYLYIYIYLYICIYMCAYIRTYIYVHRIIIHIINKYKCLYK